VVKQANPTEGETPEDSVIDIGLDATDGRAWYIVQTYSGYENKVKLDLEQRIRSMDMSDRIFNVIVPTEDEIEIRDGQRKTVPRNSSLATYSCKW